jgi:hypothetical protein
VRGWRQQLGESIGEVLSRGNVCEVDLPGLKFVADVMIDDVDMFRSIMVDGIL